jgi:PAS domain S-box-containing protein
VIAAIGEARFISLLGGLIVSMAIVRLILWEGATDLSDVVATDLLIIIPGVVLLYGGYWLPTTDLRRDVPVIVTRYLEGIGVMLGLVGVLAISTGLNRPVFTPMVGTALGGIAGFAIGFNEARALSRAHEAEQHRDQLEEERDLREQIFETSPIGIAVIDNDGSVRMVNEYAAEIIGLSEERLEGLDYDDPMFEATDSEGDPLEGGMVEKILTTGKAMEDVERRITRTDGQRIWLSINGAPLRDSSGDVVAAILAFEDITDRKQLESELKETIECLEVSNERLEQFAYAASHDLQEPLRMVSSYLQLLERRYADSLDEDAHEFIEFAVDGADRMRTMIDSLLEYSRVNQGNPLEPADANAVLEGVLDDLQLRTEETDVTVSADDLPTVTADPDQLAQVFRNLISNALKYSGDEPPEVHIDAERTGDAWRFSVVDNGVGIAPEYRDRIFNVFEQLHHSDDPSENQASGIGLAVCERIVERHDGEIWVESEPGQASTFYFTIPTTEDNQQADTATPSTRDDQTRDMGQ